MKDYVIVLPILNDGIEVMKPVEVSVSFHFMQVDSLVRYDE